MYRCLRRLSTLLFLVLINFTQPNLVEAAENPHIVVDVETGDILSQSRANDRWYPASLTKLMTAYVTFQAIRRGEIEDGSPVIISNKATRQPPSRMGYKKNVQLRIDTALKIIIIKSANDVSHALAEAVAGSLPNFVDRMNAEARRLGMINTRFANSNGLHNRQQFTSARDMAVLSARILKDFPEYSYMFKATAIKTSVKTHYSYNLLLERFTGANGMKTGFVCASGYNMVGSAQRNGRTLVSVVMGTSSQTERAVASAKLLTAGFKDAGNLGNSIFLKPATRGANPVNMRPILCTEQARANRYDPAGGQAKIKSTHLKPRVVSTNILPIKTGGVDAAPSDAWLSRALTPNGRVPVPMKSPGFKPVAPTEKLIAIGAIRTGIIPLPTPRPQQ